MVDRAEGERRLGHDRVGLELPNGLGELPPVRRGTDDASAARAIEEVHDLLGDLRRFERQHDARNLLHPFLRPYPRGSRAAGKPEGEGIAGREGTCVASGTENATGPPRSEPSPTRPISESGSADRVDKTRGTETPRR